MISMFVTLLLFKPLFDIASILNGLLNQFYVALLCFVVLASFLRNRIRRNDMLALASALCILFYSYINAKDPAVYVVDGLRLFMFVLIVIFTCNYKIKKISETKINKKHFIIQISVVVYTIMAFVSSFNEEMYDRLTFGEPSFRFIYQNTHTLAYSLIATILLAILLITYRRNIIINNIVILINIYLLALSAVRSAMIFVVLLLASLFSLFVKKSKAKLFLLSIPLIVVLLIFLPHNFSSSLNIYHLPVFSKTKMLFDAGTSIYSGRDIFWEKDLKYFISSSFINKIFGSGMDVTYNLHYEALGMKIWAHNDFIHLLLSSGLVGLSVYIYLLFRLYYAFCSISGRFLGTTLLISVSLLSITNGFFQYTSAILSIPILYMICLKKETSVNNETYRYADNIL